MKNDFRRYFSKSTTSNLRFTELFLCFDWVQRKKIGSDVVKAPSYLLIDLDVNLALLLVAANHNGEFPSIIFAVWLPKVRQDWRWCWLVALDSLHLSEFGTNKIKKNFTNVAQKKSFLIVTSCFEFGRSEFA